MAKILIIAADDVSCCATSRGLELAAKVGHEAVVVGFTYARLQALKVSSAKQTAVQNRLLADRETQVKALIEKYKRSGQKVSHRVVWAEHSDSWVTKQCAGGGYLGVAVKSGIGAGSSVHSSTNWELLRQCAAPVLLVAKNKWHRVKPVLVTLDLLTRSRSKRALNHKLLAIAVNLSQTLDVDLEIITAIEIPTLLADMDLVDPIAYTKEARASMQPQIRKLAAEFDLPEAAFWIKRGPVELVITSRAAKVRAQIVVMGTVGRGGVKSRLLGNTAERVLQKLKTDILAIKP